MSHSEERRLQAATDKYLDRMESWWREGHGEALFYALRHCLAMRITAPDWVRLAYCEGWDRYLSGVPDRPDKPNRVTLGGAFRIKNGPGERPVDRRRASYLGTLVWQRVVQKRKLGLALDEGLFEQVADELNAEDAPQMMVDAFRLLHGVELSERDARPLTAGAVREYYYHIKRSAALVRK